jgi:hypothetical protein
MALARLVYSKFIQVGAGGGFARVILVLAKS